MTKHNYKFTVLSLYCLFGIILYTSCGGNHHEDEVKTKTALNVTVIQSREGDFTISPQEVVNQYVTANQDEISGVTIETIVVENPDDLSFDSLQQTDVVLFSSVFHSRFRNNLEQFYPINASAGSLPAMLDKVFALDESTSYWGTPLLVDPIILVMEKSVLNSIGDTKIPGDWGKFRLLSQTMGGVHNRSLPHFTFLQKDPQDFADAYLAFILGLGIDYERYTGNEADPSISEEEKDLNHWAVSLTLVNLISGKDHPEEFNLSVITSLDQLVESSAFVTITRYSNYARLTGDAKEWLGGSNMPYVTGMKVTPCYLFSAAVSMNTKAPTTAKQLVQYLSDQSNLLGEGVFLSLTDEFENMPISGNCLLPRENLTSIMPKSLSDFYRQELSSKEYRELLEKGFFPVDNKSS